MRFLVRNGSLGLTKWDAFITLAVRPGLRFRRSFYFPCSISNRHRGSKAHASSSSPRVNPSHSPRSLEKIKNSPVLQATKD